MGIFQAVFQSVSILIGIGLIGFWIISRKIVPEYILKVISPLVLQIALPCLVFSEIITRFNPSEIPGWWILPLLFLAGLAFLLLLSILFSRIVSGKYRNEAAVSLFYPNIVFVPLVLFPSLFGNNSAMTTELFLFTILYSAILFNTFSFFFPGSIKVRSFNWKILLNPVIVITATAIGLSISGFSGFIPEFIVSTTQMVGAIVLPLIMILIGGNIYVDFRKRGKIFLFPIIKFVLIKNFLFPMLTLAILVFIRLPIDSAFLLFIMSAMPPVTAVPVLTEEAGGNSSIVNQFLIASFAFSLISIPLSIHFFGAVFGNFPR